MRKLTLLLLVATAAAPAMAQDRDRGGRQPRNDSAEPSDSRPQREARSSETRSGGPRTERGGGEQGGFERIREQRRQTVTASSTTPTQSGGEDGVRVRRGGGGDGGAETGQPSTNWRERERRVRTIPDTQPAVTRPATVERGGFEGHGRRDYRDGHYRRWSDHWRHDRRYDWDRYRKHHRSVFRLGYYYDPFGWNYRRWSTGSYLYPSYYGSSYWLNDPWQYRLPPAYGPYRWVRYWNDALLVNIYTGQVVDVVHGFFW